jgi:putative GTP pyrophosphokinase
MPRRVFWETEELTATLSKTQVDRLGDRLRGGAYGESDVRLLDEYRRSFRDAYESVFRALRNRGFEPTGRPAKSIVSIVEKLRRESIRLSQMQDIGGCRIVVTTAWEQERSVSVLQQAAFPQATVVDRRENPSHGYRAVHVIAEISGKPIEIQIRSSLQHLWAELSEKASDVLDPMIKYGGGPEIWRLFLTATSNLAARYERMEGRLAELGIEKVWERTAANAAIRPGLERDLDEVTHEMDALRTQLTSLLTGLISNLDTRHPTEDSP